MGNSHSQLWHYKHSHHLQRKPGLYQHHLCICPMRSVFDRVFCTIWFCDKIFQKILPQPVLDVLLKSVNLAVKERDCMI